MVRKYSPTQIRRKVHSGKRVSIAKQLHSPYLRIALGPPGREGRPVTAVRHPIGRELGEFDADLADLL